MRNVKSFVIKRTKCLRGEKNSTLHRTCDGKECCLGIYLRACGFSIADIQEHLTPQGVAKKSKVPAWLIDGNSCGLRSSRNAGKLMDINDEINPELYSAVEHADFERKREFEIRTIFAKHNVKVTF